MLEGQRRSNRMYWVVTASWEVEGQLGRGTRELLMPGVPGTVEAVWKPHLGRVKGVCRQQVELEARLHLAEGHPSCPEFVCVTV